MLLKQQRIRNIEATPEKLQEICLYSIIVNFDRHFYFDLTAYREMCKGGDRKNPCYKFFHRLYSEEMLDMLRDEDTLPSKLCPSAKKHYIRFDCFRDEKKLAEEDYLAFLLNPYAKSLKLDRECFCRTLILTKGVIHTVETIAKNLTDVDLQNCHAKSEDLNSILKVLPMVESLNFEHTRCSNDTMATISKYCPILKHLNISETRVTDEGLKYLCANTSQSNESMCKINYLNLISTSTTFKGITMIVESLLLLEKLEYRKEFNVPLRPRRKYVEIIRDCKRILPSTPTKLLSGGIPRTVYEISKRTICENGLLNVRKFKLKELVFGIYDVEEETSQLISFCCPDVTSVKIEYTVRPENIILCTAFAQLSQIELYFKGPIPSSELLEFFTLIGSKLKTLSLNGILGRFDSCSAYFSDYVDLIYWLKLCPNLKQITLSNILLKKSNTLRNISHSHLNSIIPKYPLFLLRDIELRHLGGTGLNDFLKVFLSLATNVKELTISQCKDVKKAINAVNKIHGFKFWRNKAMYCS